MVQDQENAVLYVSNDSDEGEVLKIFLKDRRNDAVTICDPTSQNPQIIARKEPFDLVLIKPTALGELELFELCQALWEIPTLSQTPILLWRVAAKPEGFCSQAQQIGVAGCLGYFSSLEELLAARDAVLRGETYYA